MIAVISYCFAECFGACISRGLEVYRVLFPVQLDDLVRSAAAFHGGDYVLPEKRAFDLSRGIYEASGSWILFDTGLHFFDKLNVRGL